MDEWVWCNGGMMLTRESPSTRTRTSSIVNSLAANPTWTTLWLNPGLSGKRLANNGQSHGTAIRHCLLKLQYILCVIEKFAKLNYHAKQQHSNNTATQLTLEGRTVMFYLKTHLVPHSKHLACRLLAIYHLTLCRAKLAVCPEIRT